MYYFVFGWFWLWYVLFTMFFLFSFFFGVPCVINVSVQYNGGLLPDSHEEVLSLQPMIPSKRFDIFSPWVGCSERSRCVQFFL